MEDLWHVQSLTLLSKDNPAWKCGFILQPCKRALPSKQGSIAELPHKPTNQEKPQDLGGGPENHSLAYSISVLKSTLFICKSFTWDKKQERWVF